jgi:two-component system sensor histidine kinase DegS
VKEIREICSRLRPSILDDLGFIPAVEWFLDTVARRHKLRTRLSLDNVTDDQRFTAEYELSLFRLVQEAVNNVVKHAQATEIRVTIRNEHDMLIVQITDDGTGFDVKAKSKAGFGLAGMRERVIHLRGSLEIKSELGKGTTVIAKVPLVISY